MVDDSQHGAWHGCMVDDGVWYTDTYTHTQTKSQPSLSTMDRASNSPSQMLAALPACSITSADVPPSPFPAAFYCK